MLAPNPNPQYDMDTWANKMEDLYNSDKNWYFAWSFGGYGVNDFTNMDDMLADTTRKTWKILMDNMQILYNKFKYVRCVEIDCEDTFTTSLVNTCIEFGKMCIKIGFQISLTFQNKYPIVGNVTNYDYWNQIITELKPNNISHINFQSYGGPQQQKPDLATAYINAINKYVLKSTLKIPIIYGFSFQVDGPPAGYDNLEDVITTIHTMNNVSGCFVWSYDNGKIIQWVKEVKKNFLT